MPDRQVDRYKTTIGRYRTRTARGLEVAWDRLGSYSESDIERFAAHTAPILEGGKRAAVATSAAFFALRLSVPPVGVNPDDLDIAPRVRDPFLALWHAISQGRPNTEALAAGRSMAAAVAENFITSAARRAGDLVAERSNRTVRWRRIPSASACEWCQLVAGQTYLSAESADFGHDRCDCTAIPG